MSISVVKESIEWGGLQLSLETGKLASQATGSVLVRCGGTTVLVTVVLCPEQEEAAFFPLNVQFVAKSYATGKIPGGFIKREGKLSDREVLISRLIDRTIRPMFPEGFLNEVGVICSLISYDPACVPEVPALIGTVAACMLAKLPLCDVVSGVKVGLSEEGHPFIDLKYNSHESMEVPLDLFVSSSKDRVYMLEIGAQEVSRECLLNAIQFGVESVSPVIDFIKSFVQSAGDSFVPQVRELKDNAFVGMFSSYVSELRHACSISSKVERSAALAALRKKIKNEISGQFNDLAACVSAIEDFEKYFIRESIISSGLRVGGRSLDKIREIDIEYDCLSATHGSAVFTRGDTQSLVVTTLGTVQDAQVVDDWDGNRKETFLLHYNFPSYAVGESSILRSPGRREIGHGRLAWKAIKPVLPSSQSFPYTIRVVSEILSSDGSSSMATVCGTSLSLMDAGVPLKSAVAGIAMGCVISQGKLFVFSDICGEEDFAGDMDFKVAGTKNGITAVQMDIKVDGVPLQFFSELLSKAEQGMLHILEKMDGVLSAPREVVKCGVPCISSFKIHKDKIRLVIGTGGRTIRDICEKSGAKIEVDQSGVVTVSGPDGKSIEKAKSMIHSLVINVGVGIVCDGIVSRVTNFGVFVDLANGKKGMAHVSELSEGRIESASDVFDVGDALKVVVLGEDRDGKLKLSVKQAVARGGISYGPVVADGNAEDGDNTSGEADSSKDHQSDSAVPEPHSSQKVSSVVDKKRPSQRQVVPSTASRKHSGAIRDDASKVVSKQRNFENKQKPAHPNDSDGDTSAEFRNEEVVNSSSSSSSESGTFSSSSSRFF